MDSRADAVCDSRVYIEDIMGDEIEVDLLVRDKNDNLVGVYLEGPMTGHEFVLTREMIQDANKAYGQVIRKMQEEEEVTI